MTRPELLKASLLILAMCVGTMQPARADFELSDLQGRRVLLKDDGTWRYADDKGERPGEAADKEETKNEDMAELQMTLRIEAPGGCRFQLTLTNNLPYEIRSLVPDISVLRANGVAYATQNIAFGPVKPGDKSRRAMQFEGISCQEIAKVRVQRGDRCEMGELNRFSDAKGQCLAKLRVLPSELVPFEK